MKKTVIAVLYLARFSFAGDPEVSDADRVQELQRRRIVLTERIEALRFELEQLENRVRAETNDYSVPLPVDIDILTQDVQVLSGYMDFLKAQHLPYRKIVAQLVHHHNQAFLKQYLPTATLPKQDVEAIVRAVETTDGIDQRVLSVKIIDANNVEVTTGYVKGPLYGGGAILHLHRNQQQWDVIRKHKWIS